MEKQLKASFYNLTKERGWKKKLKRWEGREKDKIQKIKKRGSEKERQYLSFFENK